MLMRDLIAPQKSSKPVRFNIKIQSAANLHDFMLLFLAKRDAFWAISGVLFCANLKLLSPFLLTFNRDFFPQYLFIRDYGSDMKIC